MIYNNIIETIGATPIVRINNLVAEDSAEVYVKLEGYNPAGSIKDRVALAMIEDAEKKGDLREGMRIVEPTSGNTGIGLALVGRMKGYKTTLIMPENMSQERIALMKAYGAEVLLTEAAKGMKGAIDYAKYLCEKEGAFMPAQFDNPANPQAHYDNTASEIINDLPDLDAFVAGVGTGGTISGIGRALKEHNRDIKIIGVEPKESAVLSGEKAGRHLIQGIGAGFVPSIYDETVVDEISCVDSEEAVTFISELCKAEGLFLGISSAANILATLKVAKKLGQGKKVLTISPDAGYKYLSSGIY